MVLIKNHLNDLYILAVALLFNCHISFGISTTTTTDNNDDSIIVIPFKQTNEKLQRLSSYRIDGDSIISQISSQDSANKILQELAKMPEWDDLYEAMDEITVGDVYRSMFPNGLLHTLNERILKRYGITSESLIGKSLVFPDFTLHKIPIIPSTTVQTNAIKLESNITDNEQIAENIYDDVNEEKRKLRQQPFTDDYVYDQPIQSFDEDEHDEQLAEIRDARELKHYKMKFEHSPSILNSNDGVSNILNWLQKFISNR